MRTIRRLSLVLRLVVSLMAIATGGSLFAQPGGAASAATSSGPTLSELQTRLKRAQSDGELEPAVKQQVIELYQSAIERIEIAGEEAAKSKAFTERMNSVGEKLRLAKARLAATPERTTLTAAEALAAAGDDVEKLERMLSDRRKVIEDPEKGLQQRATAIDKELGAQMPRLEEIARDLAEIEERLTTIEDELEAAAPPDEPREVTHARQSLLMTRQMRATEERAALLAEQAWCESDEATDLLRTLRDLAERELALVDGEVNVLQEAVDQRRGNEADQRVKRAELAVTRASVRGKPIAEQNLLLAKAITRS